MDFEKEMKDYLNNNKEHIQYPLKDMKLYFQKDKLRHADPFDVCIEISGGFSDCKTLTNLSSKQRRM
jgi:hypothetical protein